MTCTVYICWRRSFFHRLKKHIDLIHCLMFHILAVFDKTDGYLTWSEWWEYFDLIFLLFSLSLSILWLTRLMGIWSGHVPSAAIVQTERHWSDLRIDDHHSLRWTQANVDDHCTLEVKKTPAGMSFVESNAIIENNLLCFWGWKTLKACFIVNIHDANVCSLFNLGGQFKTMQHWALSKQTKRVLNVVKIKWKKVEIKLNKLKGCLILSK